MLHARSVWILSSGKLNQCDRYREERLNGLPPRPDRADSARPGAARLPMTDAGDIGAYRQPDERPNSGLREERAVIRRTAELLLSELMAG